jgi:hypothetical protein
MDKRKAYRSSKGESRDLPRGESHLFDFNSSKETKDRGIGSIEKLKSKSSFFLFGGMMMENPCMAG